MEPRISIVTLGVADLGRARAFYLDGLGWKAAGPSTEDITFIQAGGLVISLYPHAALAEDVGIEPQGRGFSGITLAYNTRNEAEADAVIAEAERAGATIVKRPQKAFWGGYSGYFADPDGHLWEVAYNPHATLKDDGSFEI